MKRTITVISILLLILLVGCTTESQDNSIGSNNSNSISNEQNNIIADSVETTQVENQIVKEPEPVEEKKSLFSNDITSNSKSYLPTIDDFEMGWEMTNNKPKDPLKLWSTESEEKADERGFIEGHYITFEKGQANLADIENYESVEFSISLYSKDKVKEIIDDIDSTVEKGTRSYTTTEEELNDDFEYEDVEVEVILKLAKLKNPNIGDESVFWSESEENEFWGEIKKYRLAFVEKNAYVEIYCEGLDTEKSINNCIDNAKLVSKKI